MYLLNTILSLLGYLSVFNYTETNVVLRYFHEKSYFIFQCITMSGSFFSEVIEVYNLKSLLVTIEKG